MATMILTGFGVVSGGAGVLALLLSRRGRPWTAALAAVVAMLALTPALAGLPDDVLCAGLLAGTGVLGGLLWPRPDRAPSSRPDASRPAGPDDSPDDSAAGSAIEGGRS